METNKAPSKKYDLIKQEQMNSDRSMNSQDIESRSNNQINSSQISNESIEIHKLRSEHFEEFSQLINSEFSIRRKLEADSYPENNNNNLG